MLKEAPETETITVSVDFAWANWFTLQSSNFVSTACHLSYSNWVIATEVN